MAQYSHKLKLLTKYQDFYDFPIKYSLSLLDKLPRFWHKGSRMEMEDLPMYNVLLIDLNKLTDPPVSSVFLHFREKLSPPSLDSPLSWQLSSGTLNYL